MLYDHAIFLRCRSAAPSLQSSRKVARPVGDERIFWRAELEILSILSYLI